MTDKEGLRGLIATLAEIHAKLVWATTGHPVSDAACWQCELRDKAFAVMRKQQAALDSLLSKQSGTAQPEDASGGIAAVTKLAQVLQGLPGEPSEEAVTAADKAGDEHRQSRPNPWTWGDNLRIMLAAAYRVDRGALTPEPRKVSNDELPDMGEREPLVLATMSSADMAMYLDDLADAAEGEPTNVAWNLQTIADRLRKVSNDVTHEKVRSEPTDSLPVVEADTRLLSGAPSGGPILRPGLIQIFEPPLPAPSGGDAPKDRLPTSTVTPLVSLTSTNPPTLEEELKPWLAASEETLRRPSDEDRLAASVMIGIAQAARGEGRLLTDADLGGDAPRTEPAKDELPEDVKAAFRATMAQAIQAHDTACRHAHGGAKGMYFAARESFDDAMRGLSALLGDAVQSPELPHQGPTGGSDD